ncbi:MAG: nucleotidyltransferase domain-containing protein, partial [Acidimicrobiaceae bacterium]|nr:nucleotidyltransferase domain-containing protein [Acidimicrobiaceae bacterium]
MEAVGDAAAPTIDDARRAGRALAEAGAREVMVFGSVAKGEARPCSDIDLVVGLDDLDYRSRRATAHAPQGVAAHAG